MSSQTASPPFAVLVQDFFRERLIAQRNASARTIASYRDAFRLLLHYVEKRTGKSPVDVALADLDAPLISDFLDHLEAERRNSIRTRNVRLAAIRSFLRYASFRDPGSLATIQRGLAIPAKLYDRSLLGFLSRGETEAIISAPDISTWSGHRDHVMLATFYNTGARVSEIAALRVADIELDHTACVLLHGKGRKERMVPLWKTTTAAIERWLPRVAPGTRTPVFPNRRGLPLTRSGVEDRLRVAVALALPRCPSLRGRRISPHTIRHTTAMHLLQSGVDITMIAAWLGHESPATTHLYVEADLAMKEKALGTLQPPSSKTHRFRATDRLLAFLDGLSVMRSPAT